MGNVISKIHTLIAGSIKKTAADSVKFVAQEAGTSLRSNLTAAVNDNTFMKPVVEASTQVLTQTVERAPIFKVTTLAIAINAIFTIASYLALREIARNTRAAARGGGGEAGDGGRGGGTSGDRDGNA